jgi:PIN domain nuclease of toxin-antitoxin system
VILILDAHVLVWWLRDDPTLSNEARAAIIDPQNDVNVSTATVWELAMKRARGKIELPDDLTAEVEREDFSSLPVTSADAEAAAGLPPHHRDPFDRMLVAQATRLGAVIVSRDAAILGYEVDVLRA